MTTPRRVFLSYRSVDQAQVVAVAEKLRQAGIDAWYDGWEITPGDNFVSKINEGLDQCDCGIVFLSNKSLAGAWHQEEITILKDLAVNEKRPLIPVLMDASVKVPPILRVHSRLTADQIPQLIDAICGRTAKPDLGPALSRPDRICFSIHLRELDGAIGVSARLDGKPLVPEVQIRPGAAFQFSYADFLRDLPSSRMGTAAEFASSRYVELQKLGDAIGHVVFTGQIDHEFSSRLPEAAGRHHEIELAYEVDNPKLLSIPFEAARLSDGRAPSLIPGVFTWRVDARGGDVPNQQPPLAGPLRVLVAVGAPDEGKTPNSVLDSERELQTILDSLESARRLGNAYVHVLEIGSPDQIGAALRERSYHVLHLSGHGNQGILELEDEDGNPVKVTAKQIADKIHESGHRAPLVFLASCHGGLGDQASAGFAEGLLKSGVPGVLAMQTAVSDWYATELAGKFYEELARAEQPFASRALDS